MGPDRAGTHVSVALERANAPYARGCAVATGVDSQIVVGLLADRGGFPVEIGRLV